MRYTLADAAGVRQECSRRGTIERDLESAVRAKAEGRRQHARVGPSDIASADSWGKGQQGHGRARNVRSQITDRVGTGPLILYLGGSMRTHLQWTVLLFAGMHGFSSTAEAQRCTGYASFAAGAIRASVGAEFTEGAKGFGGGASVGVPVGVFGGGSVAVLSYDGIPESATQYAASVGYAFATGGTVQVCPIVGYSYQSGPKASTFLGTAELTANYLNAGLAIGGVVTSTGSLEIVPFAAGSFVHGTATASLAGVSSSASRDYGELTLGAGFVLGGSTTLRPAVSFPLGLDGAKPTFGISLGVNFGR